MPQTTKLNIAKDNSAELLYRIREMSTGVLFGSNKSAFFRKKGACYNECKKLNYQRTQQEIDYGVEYEVVTYDIIERGAETPLEILMDWSFDMTLNANDFFQYACADGVKFSTDDLWIMLPLIKKHGHSGVKAVMSYIRKQKPIRPDSNYNEAMTYIEKIVADTMKKYPDSCEVYSIELNSD
jgi:hypothetical protein